MSAGRKLAKTKVREKGGAVAASRLDFQKDWGICEILRRHEKNEDYVAIFDHQDDLVFGDKEAAPKKLDFYQIKTTEKASWSVSQLTKLLKKGQTSASILGKLFHNRVVFKTTVASLNFVSNAGLKVELADGRNSLDFEILEYASLDDAPKKTISTAIKAEHKLGKLPALGGLLNFHRTDLALRDSQTHAIGKFSEFLDRCLPQVNVNPKSVYTAIFHEARRRTNKIGAVTHYKDLLALKGIGRSFIEKSLQQLGSKTDFDTQWKEIRQNLIAGQVSIALVGKLEAAWRQLEVNLMAEDNLALESAMDYVRSWYAELLKANDSRTISELLSACVGAATRKALTSAYTDEDIQAMLLYVIYEKRPGNQALGEESSQG